MACSSSISSSSPVLNTTRITAHVRSISLPSRPHPLSSQLDEQLSRLRSSEFASASTSSTPIVTKLKDLKDLYESVDEFLVLHLSQRALATHGVLKRSVDGTLDRSLRLLDLCGTSRDVLMQIKECVHDIQSLLRRRYSGELSIDKELARYTSMRKNVKKTVKRCLNDIKSIQKSTFESQDHVLSEVEAVTAETFESLLSYIAQQKKTSSWCTVVSKLLHKNQLRIHDKDREGSVVGSNEFEDVEVSLQTLVNVGQKKKSGRMNMMQAENLRNQMLHLESAIQELDQVLECLFRNMVKSRATFLNVLSN